MHSIPVVIAAYNRPDSLQRVLDSLNRAAYPEPVKLIISIDGGGNPKVKNIAADFEWEFGDKELILHDQNLGLRNHILSCGDLTKIYDGIILLEDDLYVSPCFYQFVIECHKFYASDDRIAGISLYAHLYNETSQFPFIPIENGTDVFFLKYASSWGQCWTSAQWSKFRAWYDKNHTEKIANETKLPPNILLWPKTSWKKYFIKYMINNDLYFVYPKKSMTTYFSDSGTHMKVRERFLQTPLWNQCDGYRFKPLSESVAVYDTYCEILPECFKTLAPSLQEIDFEVDLYGTKPLSQIKAPYLLSVKSCKNPVRSFAKEMKPHETNIIANIPGHDILLGTTSDFRDKHYLVQLLKVHEKNELTYWYPMREYHFSRKKIISTHKKTDRQLDIKLLFQKVYTLIIYTYKYFFGKKK